MTIVMQNSVEIIANTAPITPLACGVRTEQMRHIHGRAYRIGRGEADAIAPNGSRFRQGIRFAARGPDSDARSPAARRRLLMHMRINFTPPSRDFSRTGR